MNDTNNTNSISISSSAMLVDLNIGTWTARKMDKSASSAINKMNNADDDVARVHKGLLSGTDQLARVIKYSAMVRNWVYKKTLPWSDSGLRLISTADYFEFKREMDEYQQEFYRMVDNFLTYYPTLISAQAFKMGAMFNRDEYPTVDDIRHKFRMSVSYLPVPEVGDFRVDIGNEATAQLRADFEADYKQRMGSVLAEIKGRLIDNLRHVSERFTDDENDGKERKRFRNDILEKLAEQLSTIRQLQLTKDEAVNALVQQSEKVIENVTIDEIKENAKTRADVRAKVNSILESFAI
jgi:hypothetical protein